MSEITLYVRGNLLESKEETVFELPAPLRSRPDWECALIGLSLQCAFSPTLDDLYVCANFIEDSSFIDRLRAPVLRHLDLRNRNEQYLSETFHSPIFVSLRRYPGQRVRLRLTDHNLQNLVLPQDVRVHYALTFRPRKWVP